MSFQSGTKAIFRAELCKRQRRGEQLHIGRRNKIVAGVLFIQDRAGLRVGNQQTPLALACRRGTEQQIRAGGKTSGRGAIGSPCTARFRLEAMGLSGNRTCAAPRQHAAGYKSGA